MDQLETQLDKLSTCIEEINNDNEPRILSQQETVAANSATAEDAMTSVKICGHPVKVRESLHTKEKEGMISRKIDGIRGSERNSEITSNIATEKSKTSKRTVVANEAMARLLQTAKV